MKCYRRHYRQITRPDAVQEFRLLTSNFEAEFGRNTGSIVNVVTKSGTNEYHGMPVFSIVHISFRSELFDNALAPAELQELIEGNPLNVKNSVLILASIRF